MRRPNTEAPRSSRDSTSLVSTAVDSELRRHTLDPARFAPRIDLGWPESTNAHNSQTKWSHVTVNKRLARGILVSLSAALLFLSVTGWAASERYLAGLSQVEVFGGLGGGTGWSGQPLNILVVGSDDRSGLSRKQRSHLSTGHEDYGSRTDTLMLVHLGSDLGNVSITSLPRDSLVTIPAHTSLEGEQVAEHEGKINSAFATGGPAVTVATVEEATGVTIDHYVEINFEGFLSMVKAVKGVPVCLETPLYDEKSGLDLPAGRQTIRGKQALAYVRARYIDNDFGRAKRQQKFIAAMAQKVTGSGVLLNPIALNSFVDAAVSSVTTDERLGRDDIAALAARVAGIELDKIQFTTVPISDGSFFHEGESTVLWDSEAATELFTHISEDRPIPEPPKATPVDVPPGDISVRISSSQAGEAARVAEHFAQAGFQVQEPTAIDARETTVRYDPVWERSLATMKAVLPEAVFVEVPGLGSTFEVQVADDYSGLRRVRAASTTVETSVRSAKQNICSE